MPKVPCTECGKKTTRQHSILKLPLCWDCQMGYPDKYELVTKTRAVKDYRPQLMAIVITLSPELEALLRHKANQQGQDLNAVASELLASVLEWEAQDTVAAIAGIQQSKFPA